MKHAINAKTLEQSALAAHALFVQNRDNRLDWLVDRHFVIEHLVPTLLCRLQAHLPIRLMNWSNYGLNTWACPRPCWRPGDPNSSPYLPNTFICWLLSCGCMFKIHILYTAC